ncbi:DNA distortion polypeptide 3 [Escherichia coli]|nr:DNA distortion polypeptide 3 [Escherichia coli]EID9834017.1 DNA distortion polypeptide 3 [Salmonella enterica]OLW57718.1 DNA distortion protein 3 [Salmonella enterica subsp. enterica serovar Infantis str. CVM N19983]QPE55525.1 DNA distortion polypeptide 3 [Escherichia coli O20:H12]EIM0630115.1 DNA distortion polypeptide 3 [Salmonella enterica]
MTSLTPFRNVCPLTYSRFLLEIFMKYLVKEFINEKYSKAVNILKDNLKEHYHVFYGLRLSEILFPASEYGSDAFFKEFELINSVILPLVIFDFIDQKPIMVIGFGEVPGIDSLIDSGIEVVLLDGLSDLLLVEKLMPLFD